MNTTCREFESGAVVFEWRPPTGTRFLLGGMLFPLAVFFGYHLFSALFEYIRVATLGEWLTALPGIVIVAALFLLFAVPCWAVCAGCHLVIIDRSGGIIVKALDLRFYRRIKTYPLDQVQHVSVVRHNVRQKHRISYTTCRVLIRFNHGKPIPVSHGDRPDHARMIAEQVAGYLGVSAL